MTDFSSDDFQQLLSRYETAQREGGSCYFDSDDYIDLSDYYLDIEQPELALEAAEEGIRLHPFDDLLPAVRAGVLIYMKRFDEARVVVDELDESSNYDVIYLQAQLRYGLDGNPKEADALFREWLECVENEWHSAEEEDDATPEEAETEIRSAYMHIIMSYVELGEVEREKYARNWVKQYLKRFHTMGQFDSDLAVADICRDESWIDFVELIFLRLLDNDPYLPNGWTILAAAQQSLEKYDEALNSLGFALAINPDDATALLTQAYTYYGMQNYADALPVFLKCRRLFQQGSEDQYIAYCYMALRETELSIQYWKSAYEYVQQEKDFDDDQRAWKYYEISDGLMNVRQDKLAGEVIDKALVIAPENIDYLMQKGSVLLATERLVDASDLFMQLVKSNPEYHFSLLFAIAIRYIAFNYPTMGELILSFLQMSDVDEETFPQRDSTYAYHAFAIYTAGLNEGLEHQLQKACQLTPDLVHQLFADLLPDTVLPQDYYDYLLPQLRKKSTRLK